MATSAKRYDLVVIGGGPGGYVAALRAHQLGMSVAIAEKERLGGICLNWGCIPTKSLLKDAEMFRLVRDGKTFGFSCEGVRADMNQVVKRSRQVSNRLAKGIESLMKKAKIPVHIGRARITAPGQVTVEPKNGAAEVLQAENIILATGAVPIGLPNLKVDEDRIITSTQAMLLQEVPERLVVVGGGAIGIEFAYYFNAFGSKVTIVELLPRILPMEDAEVTEALTKALTKQGIEILTASRVESAKTSGQEVALEVKTPAGDRKLIADRVLVSVGVRPNSADLGLESIGVKVEKGFIQVDKKTYRTTAPNVYAVGDINGPPFLAHVASAEGVAAVEAIAGKQRAPINYNAVPRCVYCHPQVASVGMTEEEAKQKGHAVKVGRFPFRANGRALATGDYDGFVKIIADEKYGEILGAQILGPEASDLIAELCLAINLEATPEDLINTVHAHPTLSEAVMEAAGVVAGRAIHI